jgi:hypothetical protein
MNNGAVGYFHSLPLAFMLKKQEGAENPLSE